MNAKALIQRFIHSNTLLRASFSKNDLAKLRKKTGYTFANCKKALEVNNNDVSQAEKWLKEQAQALGWAKATKLEGRSTLQGLIGLSFNNHSAVLLEVNCETDFVARNAAFSSFVGLSLDTCVKHFKDQPEPTSLVKVNLGSDDLKSLVGTEGKTLADHAALVISNVGENIHLRRACFVNSPRNVYLCGYTHPSPDKLTTKVSTGKYGAIVAYSTLTNDATVQQVARQICQHIVGMNPSKVGNADEDEPDDNKDDEMVMIYQDFLIDPSITVGQVLEDVGLSIVDFIRYECGEQIEQHLDPALKIKQTA